MNTDFKGKTFVVTGEFKGCRDAVKQYFTERGGKVTGSIGLDVDYVITGELREGVYAKLCRAHELGILVFTFEEFKHNFDKYGFSRAPGMPMVHVGALLMYNNAEVEVVAISNGTACITREDGSLNLVRPCDLLPRPTEAELAHKKAVDEVMDVLNASVERGLNGLYDYAEALIAAGYHNG